MSAPDRRSSLYWVAGVALVAALAGVGMYVRGRSSVPAAAPFVPPPRVVTTGQPADWTRVAKVVASVPGHAHCFSLVDAKTVRIIWGNPRKAEDVDVDSGARRPASLVSEAFATGCPELSPDRRELLFTANTAEGATEIRRSATPDGKDAKTVTPGWDPVWLKNGEEFAYTADAGHVAVFSLPSMTSRLLPDPRMGRQTSILGKTAGRRAETLAVMYYGADVQWAVAVYEGAGLDRRAAFAIPGARGFRFAEGGDRLFISPREPRSALTALDWRQGGYRKIGTYAGMDLVDALVSGETGAVLARRLARDAWLYETAGRRRLTTDGDNDAAAISPRGELLLARPGPESTENIWLRTADGTLRKVSGGSEDTSPDFSPDGRTWIYVDYPRRSIMLCTTGTDQCRVLRRDELLPSAPRFSPDGSKVAYVRIGATSRMMVFSVADGKEWPIGATHWQCPPVWSSADNVWTLEESPRGFVWVEKEVETALRTGRRIQVTEGQGAISDEPECWPKVVEETSPLFRRLRVETEETSSILRLQAAKLSD